MAKKRLAVILGIRPDVIRACLILNTIRSDSRYEVTFIWSGQHYAENLKDIFFRELKVAPPEIELNAKGTTDAEVSSAVIPKLHPIVGNLRPDAAFFRERSVEKGCYYAMTCHRRENVHDEWSLRNILALLGAADRTIYFPASYRTQRVLRELRLSLPRNVIMVDPVGYEEFLVLMTNSAGVITDSGTVVEETCVLGIPSLQIRKSTERPQVYDVGSGVKFDPTRPGDYPHAVVFEKLESLRARTWPNPLGDGK